MRRRFAMALRAARIAALCAVMLSAIAISISTARADNQHAKVDKQHDESDVDDKVAAGIYQAAVAVYARGYYRDAIDLFVEANRLRPSAALSFNIARSYEQLHDAKNAITWYRDYLQRSNDPRDAAKVRRRIAQLEKSLDRKGSRSQKAPSTRDTSAPSGGTSGGAVSSGAVSSDAITPPARRVVLTFARSEGRPAAVGWTANSGQTVSGALDGVTGAIDGMSAGVAVAGAVVLVPGTGDVERASAAQVAVYCTPSKVKASVSGRF